jgi:hypothetical protein
MDRVLHIQSCVQSGVVYANVDTYGPKLGRNCPKLRTVARGVRKDGQFRTKMEVQVSTVAYSLAGYTQLWTLPVPNGGESVRFCVQLGKVYAKTELCRRFEVEKFRFCVQLAEVYAETELCRRLPAVKFRICVQLAGVYANAVFVRRVHLAQNV